MAKRNRPKRDVVIRGTVRKASSGEPVFGARVRHSATRACATSGVDGRFRLDIPSAAIRQPVELLILASDFWPARVRVPHRDTQATAAATVQLDDAACSITPVASAWTDTFRGRLASWCGPRLLYHYLGLTRREQILTWLVLLLLLPPSLVIACDYGLRIPGTSVDDVIRERIQMSRWLPSQNRSVRFASMRPRYYSGVTYTIPRGTHEVKGTITIEPGATVSVEPGAVFRMHAGSGVHVEGRLIATGTVTDRIVFQRASPHASWANVSFWGSGASGSLMSHCTIQGGSGKRIFGSDAGGFSVGEGDPVGGGVLIYDAMVTLDAIEIRECVARYGGGIYMRNSPDRGELGSATLTDVKIIECIASDESLAGGGGLFLKQCYPELTDIQFVANKASGTYSCGGGLYIGVGGRAKVSGCVFVRNEAAAEGGGAYVYRAKDEGDRNRSGLVAFECDFAENSASGCGGGLMVQDSPVALRNVSFRSNRVRASSFSSPSHAQGGGMCIKLGGAPLRSTLLIEDCKFRDNECASPEGLDETRLRDFSGGGLHIGLTCPRFLYQSL